MIRKIEYILAFCFYGVSAAKFEYKSTESVTFTQWLSLIVSRGIYLFLLSLIIICVLITAYKNKKNQRRLRNEIARTRKAVLSEENEDTNGWVTNLWKGPQMFSLQGNELFNRNKRNPLLDVANEDSDKENLSEKLREAEIAVAALREELDVANKGRLELETVLENLERDKSCSEDELRKTKLSTSLELEDMKKEISVLQRQLNQAQTEKTQLSKDLEAISRENRITDSALRDQQNLSNRLDEAKDEIKNLKEMMESMRSERDAAVKIASELVTKARGVTKESLESRKLIRDILEASGSRTTAFSLDMIGDGPSTTNTEDWGNEDESEMSKDDFRNADEEDGDEQIDEDTTLIERKFTFLDNEISTNAPTSRLVTNSPEFRAFLQATFRVNSLSEEED